MLINDAGNKNRNLILHVFFLVQHARNSGSGGVLLSYNFIFYFEMIVIFGFCVKISIAWVFLMFISESIWSYNLADFFAVCVKNPKNNGRNRGEKFKIIIFVSKICIS